MSANTLEHKPGTVIGEGKTKRLITTDNPALVKIESKDDITAGDGAKHDVIANKASLATRTTCNVFGLLKSCGLPIAFNSQCGDVSFIAPLCKMLPYEVVIRREAHGSYPKRSPHLSKGHLFPKLLVEFFLKTSGKRWKEHELLCDDPLMHYQPGDETIALYEPSKPFYDQAPFRKLRESEVFGHYEEWRLFPMMEKLAKQAFLVLEKAWQLEGKRLVDFKVEFGQDTNGQLLLADVIDNDSWRIVDEGGRYLDKQYYRDGGDLENTKKLYELVAGITDRFRLPTQQLVLWQGSESDKVVEVFSKHLEGLRGVRQAVITCSAHKEPVRALGTLSWLVQNVPDAVIIAYVGRSNGLGPTLAANTTAPVITVPASVKDFREDIWSSLRAPSNDPVMTILEPSNAALAAKNILAARNPHLYMTTRFDIEERMTNIVLL